MIKLDLADLDVTALDLEILHRFPEYVSEPGMDGLFVRYPAGGYELADMRDAEVMAKCADRLRAIPKMTKMRQRLNAGEGLNAFEYREAFGYNRTF